MLRIHIGFDRQETIAYHVLCHSIISRSSVPVQFIPLYRGNLKRDFWRPRGELDSTDFSNSRWVVPHLCNYKGWALYMDSDMLCLADIDELWEQRDDRYSVMVKKHNYTPTGDVKFLGNRQHKYSRKNWSSLMMYNCAKCQPLTKHIVNTAHGLFMHRFEWLADEDIGEIKGPWNLLVAEQPPEIHPKLVHFTLGGPWHGIRGDYSEQWYDEFTDMMEGDNPIKWHEAQTGSTV